MNERPHACITFRRPKPAAGANHLLGRNHAKRNDFESRRDAGRGLQTDGDEDIIRDRFAGTKHQDLRCPRAAFQLPPRHGANGRISRSVHVRGQAEVQDLHRLSVIRIGDEAVFLVHDEVARGVEGQDDGVGAGGAVESEDGPVAVVELAVGAVEVDAVEDDARVLELEDEGGEGAGALGDGDGGGDGGRGRWGFGRRGGVGGADAGAGARVADRARTG